MKQTVYIEGMHCMACAGRVERVFLSQAGVRTCQVILEEKKAVLEVSQPLSEALLRETVENLGFDFIRAE